MQNKYIIHIIIANLLWSLIPVVVIGLFSELSIILIIFLRFFWAGIILLIIAFVYVYFNNRYRLSEPIQIRELFQFVFNKNENFYNIRNIYYFAIMGFLGIILQLIWFFLALKITTISFVMIGFVLSVVIIALYEHEVKSEKLDVFKILYLVMLVFSIGIIIFVKAQESAMIGTDISLMGFLYVIFFSMCITFLHLTIKRDSYSKKEIKIINKNKEYKIPRLLIKVSMIFLTGIALMFPFIFILYIIPVETDLTPEIALFFEQVFELRFLLRWEVIFLIFFATIIPYILIFIAQVKWTAYNLTYSQWSSILTIIEPIGSLFFGFIIVSEYFPIEFLIIVLFLLIMAILLRYTHEAVNKVNAYILIEKQQGFLAHLPLKILKIDDVCCVNSLIGTHDLMIHVKTNSITKLYYLVDMEIRKLDGIKKIKILFINKIHKI